jgi:hypothetical protein
MRSACLAWVRGGITSSVRSRCSTLVLAVGCGLELADCSRHCRMDDAADVVYCRKETLCWSPERMTGRSISRTPHPAELLLLMSLAAAASVWAQSNPTSSSSGHDAKSMTANADELPSVRQAYTEGHHFLIRLLSVPSAIRLQQYFTVRLAVYDGNDPQQRLSDVRVEVAAGMAHGMAQGFAHGMQSAPKVEMRDGVVTVSGLFLHMPGDWTMQVTVHHGGDEGTASFKLLCCKQ